MNKKLKIKKPYVETLVSHLHGDAVRLCSNVEFVNPNTGQEEIRCLYYEFERKYELYLCSERSDAMVSGLLVTAMENGYDIEFEAPISERLYYQLSTYFIPMLSKYNPERFKQISINGPFSSKAIANEGAVATGCSGGVDSYYTMARHSKENMIEHYRLTHLVFASCGTLDNDKNRIEGYYMKHLPDVKQMADSVGCECIGCFNNLHEFYKFPYKGFCTVFAPIYGSVAFAIQKLLKTYYESSGDPISFFTLNLDKTHGHDGSVFDVFSLSCLCTENLSFYSTGMECSRLEKEAYISSYAPASGNLTVCGIEASGAVLGKQVNCSKCSKCLRTMVQLYTLGTLDNFSEVFDLSDFYAHKNQRIGKMLATNKRSYVNDTLKCAKKNHIKIGLKVQLWRFLVYAPYGFLTKVLRKNIFVRKMYYKYNIDIKVNGYRNAAYDVYKDKL